MSIIGNLPDNLNNGTLADASQVMANLNFIINQVNANANPSGTFTAPAGTAMAFQQSTAPTGWVAQTSNDDYAMRVTIPANFVGTSGANGFHSLLSGAAVVDGHTLSIGEMPVHTHNDSGHTHTDSGHSHILAAPIYEAVATATITGPGPIPLQQVNNPATNTAAANIQAASANIQNNGGGGAHNHGLTNFNYKYMDFVIGVKS
ncbi:hypothetical protein Q8F57_027185 [Paraburkholderia terrae]|uniref:hypothetical protein n=1 Tax=Paraburkholderia terrae TaxID=311230 RepID=UPI00296B1EBC|nr:hypothetical protein [Paraburkholderia terrae]MDW3660302.1 hypothetical protein [Paraburkholderia terrae]